MTPARLATLGRLLHGQTWQSALAKDLGVSRDMVKAWMRTGTGQRPVADHHIPKIIAAIRRKSRQLAKLADILENGK